MKTCASLLLLSLLAFWPLPSLLVGATFTWDKDSVGVDCEAREAAGKCTKHATTFYQCPETCTKNLQAREGAKNSGTADDPEKFWELETSLNNSKTMSFDRFEGYVTVVVVLPLMPGQGQYYYDMLEHIHTVYPYSIEIVVFPLRKEDHPDVQLKIQDKTKIIMLPELMEGDEIEENPVLNYLEKDVSRRTPFIFKDRVTAYIVAFNAKFVQKQVSPKLDIMEKLISNYLAELERYLKSEF